MFVLPQSFFSPFLFLRPCSDAPLPGAGTARRGAAAALPILLVFPVGVFLDLKDQIPQLSIASNFLLCLNKRATTQSGACHRTVFPFGIIWEQHLRVCFEKTKLVGSVSDSAIGLQ